MRKYATIAYAFSVVLFGSALSDTTEMRHSTPAVRLGLDSNEAPVALYNALGSREIPQAKRGIPFPLSEKTSYAHAIFHRLPNDAAYRDIIRVGGFRKVDGIVIRREGRVYEQWTVNLLGQDINKVRERLAARWRGLVAGTSGSCV
jgi:hypothetical protein